MNPDEVEFLAEKQLISIIPTFNSNVIHLISGDVGPFRASLPVRVPLWMAINLKQQRKCKIQPPDWMNIEQLEELKEEEKRSKTFVKMPSEHYMIEAKLLLNYATDDISRADEIRTIIKDIWDIRMSKIRSSVDTLVRNAGFYATVDHLTLMEINTMRPLLPHALDQVYRMKKAQSTRLPTQSTTLSLLNSSHRGSSLSS
ncbi:hypothetical protein ILUMI_07877 [Ignelater luminosus]|uniref:DNA replication complex GINS protein PSF2 n=1 Tax=Ignelater luminosus TaxID=2038154 RepID=A0A8K0GGF9_IGNLU|nr:hypothetical protein ILUMI_07877 [Ignelater luminosus]